MKMKYYWIIIALVFTGFIACDDTWNEHYGTTPETVDQNVWDVLKAESSASKFVELVEKFQLDTLFDEKYNDVYTLFVPTNEAVERFAAQQEIRVDDVAYHITRFFIQPNNINGIRKIQTYLLKFAQFENKGGVLSYDGIPVTQSGPLYVNGRIFFIEEMVTPKPSLYEYIAIHNPALKRYIDAQDSIVLDKELSIPIGFDEQGKTVYDSVITIINQFEEEYFEVSEEFRLKTATLVFPEKELYEQALTKMAITIGSGYTSHADISEEWQQDVLIPYLLRKGVFENQREAVEFNRDTLKNILGEDVIIDFRPVNKFQCSNGYAYNYSVFEVLDSLYQRPQRFEMERLLKTLGKDRYAWKDTSLVNVESDQTFVPSNSFVVTASNDSILRVTFPSKYEGKFNLEFKSEPLFPRRYLVKIRTHMDYGGIYDIYINDQLVKTFDYYDFVRTRGIIQSAVAGVRYIPQGRYNNFDFWLDNITEYGSVKVRFEYKGPGNAPNNGFIIDYMEFVTEAMLGDITKLP
jgi:hypothetical protein